MKFKLFICLFVFSSLLYKTTIKEAPSIFAICQVELKNGDVKEGMITLGASDGQMFNTHGFYIEQSFMGEWITTQLFEFDLEFDSLIFKGKARYAENKTSFLTTHMKNINDSILTKTTEQKYQVGRKMVLHQKPGNKWYINSNLFSRTPSNDEFIEIDVSEIKIFKLLKKPSKKWITLTNRIYKEYPSIDKRDKLNRVRGGLLWYHDIINNPDLKKELEKYFHSCYLGIDN